MMLNWKNYSRRQIFIFIVGLLLTLAIWFVWNLIFNPDCSYAEVEMATLTAHASPLYNVQLGWRLPENQVVDTYRIYRSDNTNTNFIEVGFVAHPGTTFVDSSLAPGHYWWAATSRDALGNESGFSNVVDTLLVDYPADTTAPVIPMNINFEIVD